MENTNQFEFFEKITKVYRPYQNNNILYLGAINRLQNNFGYKELYDMTIRSNNALVRSIKYFKDNNINYYDNNLKNGGRLLMSSCEAYIFKKFINSQVVYTNIINNYNNTSNELLNSLNFKIMKKYGKFLNKNIDYKKYYKEYQSLVNEFYKIGQEIDDFNPYNDLDKTYDIYLPLLLNNVGKIADSLKKEELTKLEYKYKFYHQQVMLMCLELVKLNRFNDIVKVCNLELDILNDDYKKNNINIKTLKKEIK